MFLLKQGSIHRFDSFNCWMIRQKVLKMLVAKDTILQSCLFISLKSWSAKRFCFFFPVYGPEKILSLATPTLQSQPMRKSAADGACPWYFVSHICPFTLGKPTALAIVPEKLVHASKRKASSEASTEWSKPAWHLLTSLDCCASQTSSVLKLPLVFPRPTVEHCALWLHLWDHMLLPERLSPRSGSSGNYTRFPGQAHRSSSENNPCGQDRPGIFH